MNANNVKFQPKVAQIFHTDPLVISVYYRTMNIQLHDSQ